MSKENLVELILNDYDAFVEYHKTKETIGAQIVNILDEINK